MTDPIRNGVGPALPMLLALILPLTGCERPPRASPS